MNKRHVAAPLWISALLTAGFHQPQGEFDYPSIILNEQKISRIRIIATVVDAFSKEEKQFASLTLDDGSGQVRVRAFGEERQRLKSFSIGDVVLLIGRPRQYQDEIYLSPEVVSLLPNTLWEFIHRLDVLHLHGLPVTHATGKEGSESAEHTQNDSHGELSVETISMSGEHSTREKILAHLRNLTEEVEIGELPEALQVDAATIEPILKELLTEGEVYLPRPGKIRII